MVAACPSNDVFFLADEVSGTRHLVDTGACRSLFPKSLMGNVRLQRSGERLVAANGSPVPTFGHRRTTISFGGRSYSWQYLVADVCLPIMGADFLAHFDLLVDVRRRRLLHFSSLTATPITAAPSELALHVRDISDEFSSLPSLFPDVFRPVLRQQPLQPAKHGILHHIKTSGPPVFAKFRRLAPAKLAIAKQVFAEMESMGLCQKASSPWSSPLHLVPKRDGSFRPCGDYRRLNMMTEPDHYPLPNMNDLTSFLHGACIFSKLDLLKGYYQVPVSSEDIPKTAITTPFGTYTFNYSCFGLRNAGATFQRMMDGILGDLPFCAFYVDDILLFSTSREQHMEHLHIVLNRLQENGLVVRFDKCIFGVQEVDFLGHHLSSKGVAPLPSRISAIKDFPTPTTVKSLQEFIGMVNYYHRFLPDIAAILSPLYLVLKHKPKFLQWGPKQDEAFCAAKAALSSAALLAYPAPDAPLRLTTDASSTAVGAVLEQVVGGCPRPIAFFSRKLSDTESRYSTFDRELLAVYLAVRHFRHLLEGSSFCVYTDHMPLVHAFVKRSDPCSSRQQRHLSAISEFNCSFRHVAGKDNPVADALSRNAVALIHLGMDLKELALRQRQDPAFPSCKTSSSSLQWVEVPLEDSDVTLLCDTSTGRPRPWIPTDARKEVFDLVHGLSHPSRRATTSLLTQKFIWHGISRDSKMWARACLPCQRSKVQRHTDSGIGLFKKPSRRFAHIHVDIVGPLPPSEGCRYLLTIIDRSTRWPEAVPLREATSAACVNALLFHWVSRFGLPSDITSDRGSTFTSQLWTSVARILGASVHHTTSYHPESNGMVERLHRTLKAALMARCTSPDWLQQLPWVLLGLRTTPKEGIDVSSAEMVYGEPLHVPADFFPGSRADPDLAHLREFASRFVPMPQTYHPQKCSFIPADLTTATHVFVRVDSHRPPLTPPYTGPFKILDRGPKAYKVDLRGREDWVSLDRLKPAYLPQQDTPPVRLSGSGRLIKTPSRLIESS